MASASAPRLLVVEDDGLIRLDLVYTLEDLGYRTLEASSADEAIAILTTTSDVTAVLTDIDMPGSMDGIGLAHVVHERWSPLRVVVISGRYTPMEGVLPPDVKFITKPISEQMIVRTLEDIGVSSQA
jgi:CheY-like chemotaxis protein